MRRICVFAGSNPGARAEYAEAAAALGGELASRGLGVVYGGASVGLMNAVADATLAAGGEVIGVLPRGLFKTEVAHANLTKLYEVTSMHRRKSLMADLADGFIALPGGLGTFDELFEIVTWAQIGLHHKPIVLLDVAGYFTPLITLVEHASREGFLPAQHTRLLLRAPTPSAAVETLLSFTPAVPVTKWSALAPPPER
jgi:uncharacterized protein (TIGR00730 family)